MEFRVSPEGSRRRSELVVSGPNGESLGTVALSGEQVTVGRLPGVNDVALQPDPELLVTRAAHLTLEREGARWLVVDGGSVNGTFLLRGGQLRRVTERAQLNDGDVIRVLGSISEAGERRFFELTFRTAGDSQATRAAPIAEAAQPACLRYDVDAARLVLVRDAKRDEIAIRAQAHRLVRYMAERNAAAGSPALCTHEELMQAVWGDEPMHTRMELAKLVWELRKKLEPFGAEQLIENERRLGYRMRTCRD